MPVADADVDLYALTHNETSTGVAMTLAPARGRRRRRARRRRRHLGGRRVCAFDPTEVDVYYFAPQKCFASDGGLWLAACSPAAIERIERIAASRPLDPGVARPVDRPRQLPQGPDLQHARRWPRSSWPCSRSSGSTTTAASSGPPAAATARPRSSTAGPRRPSYATPFVDRAGRAQPRGRHHRPRRVDRRRPRSRRSCEPTASSTPSPTASSAATSCASRCSRPSSPTTSPRSPRCIDHVVAELGLTHRSDRSAGP